MISRFSRWCRRGKVKTIRQMLCFTNAFSSLTLVMGASMGFMEQAIAQVIPDSTLSTSVVTTDSLNFVIEAGEQAGPNLFHSFDTFSIPANGSGTFNNAVNVANIFSRVTGGQVSDIQGSISTNGEANLFLINPSGIVFGESASLNIGGSFFASTAESLLFEDDMEFSAIRPNGTIPLLNINVSPGLQMGQESGPITINGPGHLISGGGFFPYIDNGTASGLQVSSAQTLGIVAPDIYLAGGIIRAPGANIQLSSASEGLLTLSRAQDSWALDSSRVIQFGDIYLTEQSLLENSGVSDGDIRLQGRNIWLSDGSLITIQQSGSQPGGDIHLEATESIRIFGVQRIVPDQDTILGLIPGIVASNISNETSGGSPSGDITIISNRIRIEDGGSINTGSYSSGDAGNLSINVTESIELEGLSPLAPDVLGGIASFSSGVGNAGNLQIRAQNLSVRGGLTIASSTTNSGRGGDVNVQVTEDLVIEGFGPNAVIPSVLSGGTLGSGDSGSVVINAARLSILDGGVIGTSTVSEGNAGRVTINASESIHISGTIPDLALESQINSDAPIFDDVLRQQFGISEQPSGNSGDIQISTPRLMISEGGTISVRNEGLGDSGRLQINADNIFLNRQGSITALSVSGRGGNIELNVDNVLLLNHGSTVTTEAIGRLSNVGSNSNVNGGNIIINAPFILGFNNSDINASAFEGDGGSIRLFTQGLFGLEFRDRPTPKNDITASSEFGIDGTVEINAFNARLNAGLFVLPSDLVDASDQVIQGCTNNDGRNRFVVTGRNGLPLSPNGSGGSDRPWNDILPDFGYIPETESEITLSEYTRLPDMLSSFPESHYSEDHFHHWQRGIQEARGMAIAPNGEVQLLGSESNSAVIGNLTCTSNPNLS
ncbi:MAG: S-layer family protein [Cyanobacteria bacterium P01_F01_bin.150]